MSRAARVLPYSIDADDRARLIREASTVWAPDFPRQVTRTQVTASNRDKLVSALVSQHNNDAGFISVYSFPRGHTSDGYIPKVNTVMFDFDLVGDVYQKDGDETAWKTDMRPLLARLRELATYLDAVGVGEHWRFTLSGHKGCHAYIDFPPVHHTEGTVTQFKNGLQEYTVTLIERLADTADVDLREYFDVDSSDLSRLTRHPNTLHSSATSLFGENRYCVPVSLDEMQSLTVESYSRLVREPRPLPEDYNRQESTRAGDKIASYIHDASGATSSRSGETSTVDRSKIQSYRENENEAFESVDDIWFFVSDKPCIKAYYERDDQFEWGNQSHVMELFVVAQLVQYRVPYDLIVEFFEDMDGFTEHQTKRSLNEVIAREYSAHNCETMWNDAPQFCLGAGECAIYDSEH